MSGDKDQLIFENLARERFAFLEDECGMSYSGVRKVGKNDLRDAGFVSSYRMDGLKIDIGWSDAQRLVSILVGYPNEILPRKIRYIYLESFVEFITRGLDRSIFSQVYPRMKESEIFEVMRSRERLFEKHSFLDLLEMMSNKLHKYFYEISNPSPDNIRMYHDWMNSK